VCEPIFARPIAEISFGRFLLQLFQTARRFNMEIQPQLVMLQKTLFNIEGLGRRLYPELDLWQTAKPYLEKWMREQMGPRAFLRTLRREAPKWWELAPQLPGLVHDALLRLRRGEPEAEARHHDLERLRVQLRANHRRQLLAISGSGLLVAGGLLLSAPVSVVMGMAFIQPLGGALAATGIFLLFQAWSRRHS
jgi:ubiquinone biosynthesis protein